MPGNTPGAGLIMAKDPHSPQVPLDEFEEVAEDEVDEEAEPFDMELDVRISMVNSQFKLSLAKDFEANFVPVSTAGIAVSCVISRGEMKMEFWGYTGNAVVQRNGLVKLRGQKSFEESTAIAMEIVGRFLYFAQQDVGLNNFQFNIVQALATLPFEVNLNRLKRFRPEIHYNPEINARFAEIEYKDLGAKLSLPGSGKILVWCTGDCDPVNLEHTKTVEAVRRIAATALPYKIAGSERDVDAVDEMAEVPAKHAQHPRRSERLIPVWQKTPSPPPEPDDFLDLDSLDYLTDEQQAMAEIVNKFMRRGGSVGEIFNRQCGIYRDKMAVGKEADIESLRIKLLEREIIPIPEVREINAPLEYDKKIGKQRKPKPKRKTDAKKSTSVKTRTVRKEKTTAPQMPERDEEPNDADDDCSEPEVDEPENTPQTIYGALLDAIYTNADWNKENY